MNIKNTYINGYKKLGGLGPNIGSEDWQVKKNKALKVSEYVGNI